MEAKKKSVPFEYDGRVIFLIKIIALNPQKNSLFQGIIKFIIKIFIKNSHDPDG